jgi:uncharacterized membrane protein YdjX (TVP38/TMEM64 family)
MPQVGKRKKWPNLQAMKMISLFIIAILTGIYIYLLRNEEARSWIMSIQHLGFAGGIIGIVIQSIVNILPIPGEFISLILMEIYGPFWGGVYSWIGGILGAVGALYLTRWIAKPYVEKKSKKYLVKVDDYVNRHGTLGLLLVRFVPFVPYHFVNYAAGLLNVKLLSFTVTTALGILPFTAAMSGIYAGLREGSAGWGWAGAGMFAVLAGIGLLMRQKKTRPEQADAAKSSEGGGGGR